MSSSRRDHLQRGEPDPAQLARVLLPLLAAALLAACGGTPDPAAADTPPAAPVVPAVNVITTRVGTSNLTERIDLTGHIDPWVEVRVASELGGLVETVGFERGARVEEGQELARIGTDLLQASLTEAEALLAGAESAYNRARELADRQAIPRQQAITATTEYEAARARVAQSRLRLDRSIVRAPIAGVAITRQIEPGEVVAPGTVLATLHRLDRLKVVVGIPETDIALVRQGGSATIRVDAWPDRTYAGTIHFIAPSATGSTRTFPTEIAVDNPSGALRPGMIARVSLPRRAYASVVVVPRDALQERDTGTVAMIVDAGVARVRPVRLGAIQGDRVVVESGLAAGDELIVSGHRGLVEGQAVQVVEPAP